MVGYEIALALQFIVFTQSSVKGGNVWVVYLIIVSSISDSRPAIPYKYYTIQGGCLHSFYATRPCC